MNGWRGWSWESGTSSKDSCRIVDMHRSEWGIEKLVGLVGGYHRGVGMDNWYHVLFPGYDDQSD
jgi:hypothetical protein